MKKEELKERLEGLPNEDYLNRLEEVAKKAK